MHNITCVFVITPFYKKFIANNGKNYIKFAIHNTACGYPNLYQQTHTTVSALQ